MLGRGILHAFAEHLDAARIRPQEADDLLQQHRFAGARTAHDANDFPPAHIQIQAIMHLMRAKGLGQPAHLDNGPVIACHMPTNAKNTENSASATITIKIDSTTDIDVKRPRDSASPPTLSPS